MAVVGWVLFVATVVIAALDPTADRYLTGAVIAVVVLVAAGYWAREAARELSHRWFMAKMDRDPRYECRPRSAAELAALPEPRGVGTSSLVREANPVVER